MVYLVDVSKITGAILTVISEPAVFHANEIINNARTMG